MDFAEGRNDDTDNNGRDVEELLQVGGGNAEDPARDENSNRSSGLEHLDEGNREVEICQVSADQTQTEKDTNGDDSAHVDARRHLDGLSAIKEVSPSGEDLGDNGRKGQVVGGEDDGVAWSFACQLGDRSRDDSRSVRKLRVSRSHLLNRMTEELKPIQALHRLVSKSRAVRVDPREELTQRRR